MLLDKYPVRSREYGAAYEFFSEGPKGRIHKVVQYQAFESDLYNLAFGDWNESAGTMDDAARTNNNDRDKILATVASTAMDFFKIHYQATVLIFGETPAKTRLYQMGLNKHYAEIDELFTIQGIVNGNVVPFNPDRNYEGFVVSLRRMI